MLTLESFPTTRHVGNNSHNNNNNIVVALYPIHEKLHTFVKNNKS